MLGFLIGAPLVLLAFFIHTLPLFVAVFVVAAISLNFCTGPLNAVIQDIIVPNMRATAVGLALLLAHILGDAAAPTIARIKSILVLLVRIVSTDGFHGCAVVAMPHLRSVRIGR